MERIPLTYAVNVRSSFSVRAGVALVLALMLLASPSLGSERAVGQEDPEADCDRLADIDLGEDTIVEGADFVPEGSSLPGAGVVPALCHVLLSIAPEIEIAAFLPTETWNGRFQGVGNGGFAGSISYGAMGNAVRTGFATASTNTGHNGSGTEWAVGEPQKVIDFAYRSIHEMTVKGQALVAAHYDTEAAYSYFNGCSTGGRQGLMEAQRYPDDYDGILAGAPVIDQTNQHAMAIWGPLQTQIDTPSFLPACTIQAIADAVVEECDGLDGVEDGIIGNPLDCDFDPATMLCDEGAENDCDCLSPEQLEGVRALYRGPVTSEGTQVYPGMAISTEAGWAGRVGSVGGDSGDAYRDIYLQQPDWTWTDFDVDREPAIAMETMDEILNATDPDLTPFQQRGGKVLLYHGWSDSAPSAARTIQYYEDVQNATDDTEEFVRLFLAPGMGHCSGGVGPDTFDGIGALMRWVEDDVAPESIEASLIQDGDVVMTRPLCPHPETAQWTGQGSTDLAENFVCQSDEEPDPSAPKPPTCDDVAFVTFPDVHTTYEHATNIGCAAGLELLRGKTDGRFAPLDDLTRGQMASIVTRALDASGVELPDRDRRFIDVADSPHQEAIERLAAAGIVVGRTASTYEPNVPVTRGQLASILDRAASTALTPLPEVAGPRFDDIAGSPHADAIDRLTSVGVIRGLAPEGHSFGPSRTSTRGQAATLTIRWLSDQAGRARR